MSSRLAWVAALLSLTAARRSRMRYWCLAVLAGAGCGGDAGSDSSRSPNALLTVAIEAPSASPRMGEPFAVQVTVLRFGGSVAQDYRGTVWFGIRPGHTLFVRVDYQHGEHRALRGRESFDEALIRRLPQPPRGGQWPCPLSIRLALLFHAPPEGFDVLPGSAVGAAEGTNPTGPMSRPQVYLVLRYLHQRATFIPPYEPLDCDPTPALATCWRSRLVVIAGLHSFWRTRIHVCSPASA